jgi:tetratricopeptide (TPR) repeat protein
MRTIIVAVVLAVSLPSFAAEKLPEEKKGDPAPDTKTAQSMLGRGRYEDAIRQAKLALGRDERYVPAMVVMAKSYYYLKKYELAKSIVDIAQSIDPNGRNGAECLNLLGFLALTHDDKIGATAAFKKATDADGNFGPGWLNLTAQYLLAKNYDGAIDAGEKAAKLMGSNARAHLNLGSAYRGKQRYVEAEKEYKLASSLAPQDADPWFNLGILYLDAKEMPGNDLVQKLNMAVNHFNKYKQLAGFKMTKDDPVDTYLTDARTQIDREIKRQERMKKQQQRDKPKDAAATPAPAGAPKK